MNTKDNQEFTTETVVRILQRLEKKIDVLLAETKSDIEVPKKDWYRPTEVCEMLGISRSKFETYKRSGAIPVHKIFGGIYVSANDLENLFRPQT